MRNSNEGSKRKRLLAIDGKTQRGNGNKIKALSLKKKRFAIGTNPEKHLEQIMNL